MRACPRRSGQWLCSAESSRAKSRNSEERRPRRGHFAIAGWAQPPSRRGNEALDARCAADLGYVEPSFMIDRDMVRPMHLAGIAALREVGGDHLAAVRVDHADLAVSTVEHQDPIGVAGEGSGIPGCSDLACCAFVEGYLANIAPIGREDLDAVVGAVADVELVIDHRHAMDRGELVRDMPLPAHVGRTW